MQGGVTRAGVVRAVAIADIALQTRIDFFWTDLTTDYAPYDVLLRQSSFNIAFLHQFSIYNCNKVSINTTTWNYGIHILCSNECMLLVINVYHFHWTAIVGRCYPCAYSSGCVALLWDVPLNVTLLCGLYLVKYYIICACTRMYTVYYSEATCGMRLEDSLGRCRVGGAVNAAVPHR